MSTGQERGAAKEPVVFFGSGAFGVPTLERLAQEGRLALVVSQPDRPAGRGLKAQPTPVSAWAVEHDIPLLRSADVCVDPDLARVRSEASRLFVIIAFGQKLLPSLLADRFAVNLHGSLLPRWRGAAPIQRAVMAGDDEVGVCAISIAERMDAGVVYGERRTRVGATETAGDLHDRLARLGPDLIDAVLAQHAAGTLRGAAQDEALVVRARKLARADAWVDLSEPARLVAARINGLSPWPGCDATIDGHPIRLLRARAVEPGGGRGESGAMNDDGLVYCGSGAIEILEVQPPGGRVMAFDAWRHGRAIAPGAMLRSVAAPA